MNLIIVRLLISIVGFIHFTDQFLLALQFFQGSIFARLMYDLMIMYIVKHLNHILVSLDACLTAEHSELWATPICQMVARHMTIEHVVLIDDLLSPIFTRPIDQGIWNICMERKGLLLMKFVLNWLNNDFS